MASAQLAMSDSQNATIVSFANKSPTTMTLDHTYTWVGSFTVGAYPKTIKANSLASFVYLKGDKRSKAAMKYSGVNGAGVHNSMIVAWDAPAIHNPPTSPNKVYVMCGPKSVVDLIAWPEVEKLLDSATSSASSYGVEANINPKYGNVALLFVNVKFL